MLMTRLRTLTFATLAAGLLSGCVAYSDGYVYDPAPPVYYADPYPVYRPVYRPVVTGGAVIVDHHHHYAPPPRPHHWKPPHRHHPEKRYHGTWKGDAGPYIRHNQGGGHPGRGPRDGRPHR